MKPLLQIYKDTQSNKLVRVFNPEDKGIVDETEFITIPACSKEMNNVPLQSVTGLWDKESFINRFIKTSVDAY